MKKIKDIEVGDWLVSAMFGLDGKYLFVINGVNSVSVIDTETMKKIKDIEVGNYPVSATLSIDGKHLFVMNSKGNSVSVINTENMTNIKDIAVGDYPNSATLSVDGKHLFVTNFASNSVSVINFASNSVSVINTESMAKIKDIEIGKGPMSATLSGDEKHLFVINGSGNSISVINTENMTKIKDIEVGKTPAAAVIYKPSYNEPQCITMIKNVAEGITQGALEEKDIPHLFPLLKEVRQVFQAIPMKKVEGMLKGCMTVLSALQSRPDATTDLIILQHFFQGVQERLTHPLTESIFNNDAFQKAYDELVFLHSHQQGLNKAHQVTHTLDQIQQKVQEILKHHPTLTPIEYKVLTFMGLQILRGFMNEDGKIVSKNLRLQLLHFIDGYNLGDMFVIPLPGMESDNRTTKEFIRLIETGKF